MALKELLRSETEIDELLVPAPEVAVPVDAGGVVLVLLLHAPMRTAAAVAATAPSPVFADTEYNDVPRLVSRDVP
jgi:hypothetical protein